MRVGTRTLWRRVPRYKTKWVPDGFEVRRVTVPTYAWREVQVGWEVEEKRVPRMATQKVKVGSRVEWELEEAASSNKSFKSSTNSSSSSATTPGLAKLDQLEGEPPQGPAKEDDDHGPTDPWQAWAEDYEELVAGSSNGGFDLGAWKREDMDEANRMLIEGVGAADRKFLQTRGDDWEGQLTVSPSSESSTGAYLEALPDTVIVDPEERYAQFERLRDECLDSEFPRACMWDLMTWIYGAYGIGPNQLARRRIDNPVGEISREAEELAPYTLYSWMDDPVRIQFLNELDMDVDNFWNYEPVYQSWLRRARPRDYERAKRNVRARNAEQERWYQFVSQLEAYLQNYPGYAE